MPRRSDRYYLELAMEEARQAYQEGTYPIGAVIVAPGGEVLSRGRNRVFSAGDPTAHAEIDAIRQAGPALQDRDLKEQCTLYCTCEPCLMCTGAIIMADIASVVWLLTDEYGGAFRTLESSFIARHETGPYGAERLSFLSGRAAQHKDLEQAVRRMLNAWDVGRGYKPRWPVEG